ncbi:MAG: hypothetical protein M3383_06175 [Actinomycetota bacterium]|nr:hypothetical protein [Actinomycetota bacterium]
MNALSAEQRAILELLLERGLDYGAIADVTGIGAGQVRERARGGLGAFGGREPDQGLADFLLGCAEPAGSEIKARLVSRPADNALAHEIAAGLRAEFPRAELPELPPAAQGRKRVPIGVLAGAGGALLVLLAALIFAGVFDGETDEPVTVVEDPADPGEPVTVALAPLGEGGASGTAQIGLDADSRPYLDLELVGLPPAPAGQIYMLWVDNGLGEGVPLPSPLRISSDGSFRQTFRLAPELIPILDLGKNLELITVGSGRLRQLSDQVTKAGRGNEPAVADDLPERPGGVVLTGAIPDR